MIISPQFGHGNFVASVVGPMILWHDVHVGMVVVVCSVTAIPRGMFDIMRGCLYVLCFHVCVCYVICGALSY